MYGNALINLHQDVGDWAAVGLTIGEMLQEVKGH
jgi:hypothetical protein